MSYNLWVNEVVHGPVPQRTIPSLVFQVFVLKLALDNVPSKLIDRGVSRYGLMALLVGLKHSYRSQQFTGIGQRAL